MEICLEYFWILNLLQLVIGGRDLLKHFPKSQTFAKNILGLLKENKNISIHNDNSHTKKLSINHMQYILSLQFLPPDHESDVRMWLSGHVFLTSKNWWKWVNNNGNAPWKKNRKNMYLHPKVYLYVVGTAEYTMTLAMDHDF